MKVSERTKGFLTLAFVGAVAAVTIPEGSVNTFAGAFISGYLGGVSLINDNMDISSYNYC